MPRALVYLLLLLTFWTAATPAQTVTKSSFRVLEDVQLMIEEERLEEAITALEALALKTINTPYDYAIANQYLAHTNVMMDRPEKAREALAEALRMEGLPPELISDLQLFYGTVLLGEGEYEGAVESLDVWLQLAEKPTAKQLFSVAYANFMAGYLEKAEPLMAKVFEMSPREAITDTWFQVYYRILFGLNKHVEGEALLLELLERDPGKDQHWQLLAGHYMQLEESHDALASLMIAYWNGLSDDAADLRRIVSLFGYIDVPEKGARLLDTWIQEGRLPEDEESFRQLGNLWLLARDREKAKSALRLAADAGSDSKVLLLLGGIHFEDEEWVAAHSLYARALVMEDLEERDRIFLLAGISAFRAGMIDEARDALEQAMLSDEYRIQAEGMLAKIDKS